MKSEDLTGKVMALSDMVAYHPGSIVSRTIIDKPAGTLTLFAFERGQGLSEHTAPFDAMVYILDGEAEVKISDQPLQVRQGEMVIMPANEPHALRATTRFKMMLAMIKS
jgi:quercetin dioxygenase-like cupin family protein